MWLTFLLLIGDDDWRWTKSVYNRRAGSKNRVYEEATGEDDDNVRTSLTFRLRASLRSSVAVTVAVVVAIVAAAASASTASSGGGGGSCFLSSKREKEGRRGRERRGKTDVIEVSWQTVVDWVNPSSDWAAELLWRRRWRHAAEGYPNYHRSIENGMR